MLYFVGGNSWAWRTQMRVACDQYHGGSLEKFFRASQELAPSCKGTSTDKEYLGQYLSSLGEHGPLKIPEHVRRYIAQLLGLHVQEIAHSNPKPKPQLSSPKPSHKPDSATPEVVIAAAATKQKPPAYFYRSARH